MTRRDPPRRRSWADALLLAAALAPAAWVATHSVYDLESALVLSPKEEISEYFYDQEHPRARFHPVRGRPRGNKTPREYYADAHPRSLLAALNRVPAADHAWRLCAYVWMFSLPTLSVASVGFGAVACTRAGRASGRFRPGPGRVAAAIACLLTAAYLVPEYVIRRSDIQKFAYLLNERLDDVWLVNSRNVGVAILAGWALPALAGRWRPGRGWREWGGLALGVLWLAKLAWEVALRPLAQFDLKTY